MANDKIVKLTSIIASSEKKMKKHFNQSETSANKFQRKRQTDDRT